MRLLFVIDCFGSGGAQRQMVNLATGLHQRGHHVEFFIYYPQYRHFAGRIEELGIRVHEFRKSGRFSPAVIWALRKQIIAGHYDVMLSYLDTPNFYAEVARLGLSRPSLVVSQRHADLPKPGGVKWFMKQFHRLADWIVVNSYYQCERMEREFSWMRNKITTIYNGVDLREFFPSQSLPPREHAESLKLLAIGTIVAGKNVTGLVRALAIYRDCYGGVPRVCWVGKKEPSVQGQKVFSEALDLLEALHLSNSWEWLGEQTNIPTLLQEHDALIHPSFREGLPNVVCEALACGRPVLASRVCDLPRLVQNNVTGFLFDPEDPGDIAEAIHRLASMTVAEREAMGRRARLFAEQELSLETLVDRYEMLFRVVIGQRKSVLH